MKEGKKFKAKKFKARFKQLPDSSKILVHINQLTFTINVINKIHRKIIGTTDASQCFCCLACTGSLLPVNSNQSRSMIVQFCIELVFQADISNSVEFCCNLKASIQTNNKEMLNNKTKVTDTHKHTKEQESNR